MKDEEIKEIMAEYTEAIKVENKTSKETVDAYLIATGKTPDDFNHAEYSDFVKERVHKIAIECLDKILTPELKVFVKNLSMGKLGYPDEPLFYKIFGDYPKEGDKVKLDELVKQGVLEPNGVGGDQEELWFYEGNWVKTEKIEGELYLVLDSLFELNNTDSEEKREFMRSYHDLKKRIQTGYDKADADLKTKLDEIVNTLDKAVPLVAKLHV